MWSCRAERDLVLSLLVEKKAYSCLNGWTPTTCYFLAQQDLLFTQYRGWYYISGRWWYIKYCSETIVSRYRSCHYCLIQYVVFWELLHVHTVCAHCVHAFALQDCHLSQLLLSTTAVSVLQHHFFLDAAGSGATSSGDNDILCYLCSTDVTCTCKTVYTPTTACELWPAMCTH